MPPPLFASVQPPHLQRPHETLFIACWASGSSEEPMPTASGFDQDLLIKGRWRPFEDATHSYSLRHLPRAWAYRLRSHAGRQSRAALRPGSEIGRQGACGCAEAEPPGAGTDLPAPPGIRSATATGGGAGCCSATQVGEPGYATATTRGNRDLPPGAECRRPRAHGLQLIRQACSSCMPRMTNVALHNRQPRIT